MSPYVFGGLLIAFVAYSGTCIYSGYKYATYADKAAQEAADNKALVHKNTVETTSATLNQGASNAFQSQKSDIDNLYTMPLIGLPPSTIGNLPQLSKPPAGTKPASCISKKYKLTPQQCDDAKAGYILLWDDWVAQAAIK